MSQLGVTVYGAVGIRGATVVVEFDCQHATLPTGFKCELCGRSGDTAEPDGVGIIATERRRQIEEEGWTAERDDEHDRGELAMAAACYAATEPLFLLARDSQRLKAFSDPWPDNWLQGWDKRPRRWNGELADICVLPAADRIRMLAKAGALIAAEIDRLKREEKREMADEQQTKG